MRSRYINYLLPFLLMLFISCAGNKIPLFEYPPDYLNEETRNSTIESYKPFLQGKTIFIDPGHGGEDRKNANQSRTVIEADVNLRVALFLRKYFEQAGAVVLMSRDYDVTVLLASRSEMANESGADLFISIHHNAPAKWEDSYTNYTSTYYHSKENEFNYNPVERDIAKFIQRDLSYVMGNPGGLGSFDGTYSDFIIYPGEGFSVLRKTTIPSVLVECAFHTSRFEELRLNDLDFNAIQAWGIFRGIAKYYKTDKPSIIFEKDSVKIDGEKAKLIFKITDESGINTKSIKVVINKTEVEYLFDKTSSMLTIEIPKQYFTQSLKISAANFNGMHAQIFYEKILFDGTNQKVE